MGCAAVGYCYTLQDKVVRPAARCALLVKVCKERGAKLEMRYVSTEHVFTKISSVFHYLVAAQRTV